MIMHTRRQNLKTILKKYIVQEMKTYEVFENLPLHFFSENYRQNMSNLTKKPMK